jgi:Trypsin-like peptidase domain
MYLAAVFRALNVPNIIFYGRSATSRIWANRLRRYGSRCRIILLLGCLIDLSGVSAAIAQSNDEFIGAIARIKGSVAPVTCFSPPQQISVNGTAFFIDTDGTFLTAGHVIKEFLPSGTLYGCNRVGIYVPIDAWQRAQQFNARLLVFSPERCSFDGLVDVAKCKTIDNPMLDKEIHVKPMAISWEEQTPPDGAAVAFTGFPLSAVIPYTSRANIVAYPPPIKPGATHILLDKTAWPGASGSPVYISNGNVIGLIIQRGEGAASGLAVACDSQAIGRFLRAEH